ncbi:MAG: flagellar hook-length control protein FliK [Planctomycetes bacterium]|nr:flagellar hook-length control protein FliK [Planctomycetota bacterium]
MNNLALNAFSQATQAASPSAPPPSARPAQPFDQVLESQSQAGADRPVETLVRREPSNRRTSAAAVSQKQATGADPKPSDTRPRRADKRDQRDDSDQRRTDADAASRRDQTPAAAARSDAGESKPRDHHEDSDASSDHAEAVDQTGNGGPREQDKTQGTGGEGAASPDGKTVVGDAAQSTAEAAVESGNLAAQAVAPGDAAQNTKYKAGGPVTEATGEGEEGETAAATPHGNPKNQVSQANTGDGAIAPQGPATPAGASANAAAATGDAPTGSALNASSNTVVAGAEAAGKTTSMAQSTPSHNPGVTAPTPQNPEEANVARVARALQQAVQQKGGTVTLRLQPPELGLVRVQMEVVNGVASVRFQAEDETVTSMLSRQMTTLKQALEGQGLKVDRLEAQTLPQPAPQTNTGDSSMERRAESSPDDGRSRGGFTPGDEGRSRGDGQARRRTATFNQAMVDAIG